MSLPIRILHVIRSMNLGGAQVMIMNLYRSIDRSRVQFDFMLHTMEHCAYDDEILSYGGRIFRFPKFNGSNLIPYRRGWHRFFQEHPEIRVVHGHISSSAPIYLSIAKQYGCRAIAHSHSANKSDWKHRIATYPIRYVADDLIACSDLAGINRYGKRAWRARQGIVLNNGIDAESYVFQQEIRDTFRREYGLQGNFVLGHVGRMESVKNHAFLIRVFDRLRELRPDAKLLFVGDGSLRGELEAMVRERHMEGQVLFLGIRRDIPACLMAMDVFALPSIYEGLPVTAIEAQATGLPCFLSDAVTEETAITDLVRFRSIEARPEQWAEEIAGISMEERKDMSRRIEAAGYSVASTAAWLTDYYEKRAAGKELIG